MRPFPPARRVAALAAVLLALLAGRLFAADLYQVSTIGALSAGLYEGRERFASLARHGDFGLGTFANLDGEMVAVDGAFYQARSDGTVHRVAPAEKTPFAQVVFFSGALDLGRVDGLTFEALKTTLAGRLPDPDKFYAVRVDGLFPAITVRSVAAQPKPWPTLAEAVKGQKVFPLQNVKGSLVGIYTPTGAPAISPPGWHFHFISLNRTRGGHVLEATLGPAKARGDVVTNMRIVFPDQPWPHKQVAAPAAGTE